MAYEIENKTAEQNMQFVIYGSCKTLTKNDETFYLVRAKTQSNPTPQNGFQFTIEQVPTVKITIKKGDTYTQVVDEFGSVYLKVAI